MIDNKCTFLFFLISTFCFNGEILFAQQSSQYSLFYIDQHIVNPAYAGIEPELTLTGLFRNQWIGLAGSPADQLISLNAPIIPEFAGMGLLIENDRLGLEQNINIGVSYAQHIYLSGQSSLSAGLRATYGRKILDGSKIVTPDGAYEPGTAPDHKDGILPTTNVSGNNIGVGLGLLLKIKEFSIGAGADDIVQGKYVFPGLTIKRQSSYYASIGWDRSLNEILQLDIVGMLRNSGKQFQSDIVVKLSIKNNIFVAGSFRGYNNRTIDAATIGGGFRVFENLIVYGAYDLGMSNLKTSHSGTTEFGLKYTYGNKMFKRKLPSVIYNTRY